MFGIAESQLASAQGGLAKRRHGHTVYALCQLVFLQQLTVNKEANPGRMIAVAVPGSRRNYKPVKTNVITSLLYCHVYNIEY